MAKRNKKNRGNNTNITNNAETITRRHDSALKSVSLRLPPHLHDFTRECSESMGLSINGVICVALSDYLHNKGYSIHNDKS